jgi:hypothetical protein
MVAMFTKQHKRAVESFVLNLVNNNCSEVKCLAEGPRIDGRVNLVVVVLVIPMKGNRLLTDESFTAVTREFSTSGISLVLERPIGFDEVTLGFRWENEMNFAKAKAKHLNPMGGGFYQLGFELTKMMHPADYPALREMSI